MRANEGGVQGRRRRDGKPLFDFEMVARPAFRWAGRHSHEANDEIFLVLEGRPSVLVGDTWHDAGPGTMLRIPAGVTHDFANRTATRAGLFNVFIPGGFEENMPAIAEWFAQRRD